MKKTTNKKTYLKVLTSKIIEFYELHKEDSGKELYKIIEPQKDKLKIDFLENKKEVSPFYIYSSYWSEDESEIQVWNSIFNIKINPKSPQFLKERNRTQLLKTIDNAQLEWEYVYKCFTEPTKAADMMEYLIENNRFMSVQETSLIGFSVNPERFLGLDKHVESLLLKENLIQRYSDSLYYVMLSVKENKNCGNTFYRLLNGEHVDVKDFKLTNRSSKPLHLETISM